MKRRIISKKCSGCKKKKCVDKFHVRRQSADGYRPTCKHCRKELDNSLENKIKSIYIHQKQCSILRGYAAPNYTRKELEDWCMRQKLYHILHKKWKASDYDRWLSPSCDRVDDYKPYTLSNIQLMTWGENMNKNHVDLKNGRNRKLSKAVLQVDIVSGVMVEYYSMSEASRVTHTHRTHILRCCKGTLKTANGYKWKYKESK